MQQGQAPTAENFARERKLTGLAGLQQSCKNTRPLLLIGCPRRASTATHECIITTLRSVARGAVAVLDFSGVLAVGCAFPAVVKILLKGCFVNTIPPLHNSRGISTLG